MSDYAAFDIETVKQFPDGARWQQHRPLGIACAAVFTSSMEQPRVWHGATADGAIAEQLSKEESRGLVNDLVAMVEAGFTLLTWNGTAFDFDVLAEESGMLEECRDLARSHVDMMLHFFCVKGYPLALKTACTGAGTTTKPEGMDGARAVRMWREGARQEVIDYCGLDTRITLELAVATERLGRLPWTSRAGNPLHLRLRRGWQSVEHVLRYPEPDTSWMDSPLSRRQFTAWLND